MVNEQRIIIAEMFGPTFQGEGPTAGTYSSFVRLGRCNLDCSWCDTPYTWDWTRHDPTKELTEVPVSAVIDHLRQKPPNNLIITGGEPLVQRAACIALVDQWDGTIEIETNGTIQPPRELLDSPRVRFNVSPKLLSSGVAYEKAIKPEVLHRYIDHARSHFKFVIQHHADLTALDDLIRTLHLPRQRTWIMPEGRNMQDIIDGLCWLAPYALERRINLSNRLHVQLWDDKRGV